MRDAVLWYLLLTVGLMGLLAVVVAVQSVGGLARRVLSRAAVRDGSAAEAWSSQPV